MKNRFENIQNTKSNIDKERDWRLMDFSHPERVIRLATSFSGIGAIEHSFQRLGLNYKIQFAGDIDAYCKKLILQTILLQKNNGIMMFMILMQGLMLVRSIYL